RLATSNGETTEPHQEKCWIEGRKVMQLGPGLHNWRSQLEQINEHTDGIVRVIGKILHQFLWVSPPQLASLALLPHRLASFTEWYVFIVLALSIGIYLIPSVWLALLSTYFSVSTVIVMLHIVLLQWVFAPTTINASRSLVLFICNVAQIVFMFA